MTSLVPPGFDDFRYTYQEFNPGTTFSIGLSFSPPLRRRHGVGPGREPVAGQLAGGALPLPFPPPE